MTEDERRAVEADCARLINHYVNCNDAQEWEQVAALYTEDAVFKRPSGGDPIVGRPAILASFLARPPRAQRHVIANIVVDVVSASEATAFSAIVLYQGDVTADGTLPVQAANSPLIGWFRDRIAKTAEGWRFAEREGGLDFRP
ncbi:MAG: nuclear transport factor 2 family protein [Candidatus Andeanibacterium colombiense]|uniref:Nuclear transport factor 2 family protein n=1 Tax=Candidatus Andeanibacterium colombiense TaxID=3121345 RepID=A0AAJ5X8B1_9SPHN|nr:MAG: nuclear transport factor 2 family protein [Sphingomonadaceae bacterium]